MFWEATWNQFQWKWAYTLLHVCHALWMIYGPILSSVEICMHRIRLKYGIHCHTHSRKIHWIHIRLVYRWTKLCEINKMKIQPNNNTILSTHAEIAPKVTVNLNENKNLATIITNEFRAHRISSSTCSQLLSVEASPLCWKALLFEKKEINFTPRSIGLRTI